MSSPIDIVTAIVPGLIGLVATLLQYYIPMFSERKSQRIQILKLISVEYNTVERYMSLVRGSRRYYYGLLLAIYASLTFFTYISIIFRQYNTYIYPILFLFIGVIFSIIVFIPLIKILSYLNLKLNKILNLRKNTSINSTNLNKEDVWQDAFGVMFFLHWKSIRNISLTISFIFVLFLTLNIFVKGPTSLATFTLSSILSGLLVIILLYITRILFYFIQRTIKERYKVDFSGSNSEGEMESEFFKIVNDRPEICIEDSKGEICGRLKGIMYGIEIENINGVYIIPFTQVLRIKKP